MVKKISRRNILVLISTFTGGFGLTGFPLQAQTSADNLKERIFILSKPYEEKYTEESLIYNNPLKNKNDIKGFVLEGQAQIDFPNNRMRIQNVMDPSVGQKANLVFWCPEEFPDNVSISWNFWPIREPGLCILFFAAKGQNGENIHSPAIKKRTGEYKQYNRGDINTYHISYFRRSGEDARAFNLCNLRKSYGHHMVAQAADPIPSVENAISPYHIRLVKANDIIEFYIDELLVLHWQDDGKTFGPVLKSGNIGFRQMAPLIAEYADLKVHKIAKIQ